MDINQTRISSAPSHAQRLAWADRNITLLRSPNYRGRTISDHSLLRKLTNQAYTYNATRAGLAQSIEGTDWLVLTDTNTFRSSSTLTTPERRALTQARNYDAVAYYNQQTGQIVIVNLGADDKLGEVKA